MKINCYSRYRYHEKVLAWGSLFTSNNILLEKDQKRSSYDQYQSELYSFVLEHKINSKILKARRFHVYIHIHPRLIESARHDSSLH